MDLFLIRLSNFIMNSHEIPCMLVWLWFSHVFQVVCNVFHVFFQCFLFFPSFSLVFPWFFPGSARFLHIFPTFFPRFSTFFPTVFPLRSSPFGGLRTRRPPRRRTWPPSGSSRRRSSARRNCRGGEMGKELWFIIWYWLIMVNNMVKVVIIYPW